MLGIFHNSLESIDFQKDNYHREMEMICTTIMSEIDQKIQSGQYGHDPESHSHNAEKETDLKKLFSDKVMERFGIKVTPYLGHEAFAAVIPSYINYNHIFAPLAGPFFYEYGVFSKEIEQINKAKHKTATIDLENARVGGFFSEIEHEMFFDIPAMLRLEITPRELAAIATHEIGHIFTFMEYCYKLNMTNQVFQQLCDEIDTNNNPKQKEIIIRNYKFGEKISSEDIEDVINSETKVVLGFKLFKMFKLEVTDLMDKSHYNQVTSEQIADNFAVRMGLGRELVTSLDKMHRTYPNPNYGLGNVIMHVINFAVSVLLSVCVFIIGLMIPILAGFAILALFNLIGLILEEKESNKDRTYDEVRDRFMRVKQQIIQQLKDQKLPKHEIEYSLKSLEDIDAILVNVGRYRGILNKFFKIFSAKDREAYNQIIEMRELEELTHNDLFVSSAKLKLKGM